MEWIKVEDKLPEIGKTVLVTIKGNCLTSPTYQMCTAYCSGGDKPGWMESVAAEYEVGDVIAWMELPKPYIDEPGEFERQYNVWYIKGTVL